ncbi:MAG TPA: Coq4 family protein [Polyangiaceae bacterium]|nr:Coq4 family protein [Polyangiaceae bacterium]
MSWLNDRLVLVRSLWSFVDLVRHPEHLDRVFEISNALTSQHVEVLGQMRDHFVRDAVGASALRDKPRLRVDLRELSRLPPGTLGRTFADHMVANGLDPAAIPTLSSETDFDFIRAHLYETHDVWHAVTGFGTDVAGELGLQAFYSAQSPGGLPLILVATGLLNTAFFAMGDRGRRMEAIARGWDMGRRARPLFGRRWDESWTKPIAEVRGALGVDPYVADVALAA